MTSRFSTTARGARAARRPRQWGISQLVGSITAATHAGMFKADLGAGIEASLGYELNNVTISAIRLKLTTGFQSTVTLNDFHIFQWGIALVGTDAFVAGGVSLPDPTVDDADWIAHGAANAVSERAGSFHQTRNGTMMIENNSMRKMRENHSTLAFLLRAVTLTDPMDVSVQGRVLFLLP